MPPEQLGGCPRLKQWESTSGSDRLRGEVKLFPNPRLPPRERLTQDNPQSQLKDEQAHTTINLHDTQGRSPYTCPKTLPDFRLHLAYGGTARLVTRPLETRRKTSCRIPVWALGTAGNCAPAECLGVSWPRLPQLTLGTNSRAKSKHGWDVHHSTGRSDTSTGSNEQMTFPMERFLESG